jgi:hypothetical protein
MQPAGGGVPGGGAGALPGAIGKDVKVVGAPPPLHFGLPDRPLPGVAPAGPPPGAPLDGGRPLDQGAQQAGKPAPLGEPEPPVPQGSSSSNSFALTSPTEPPLPDAESPTVAPPWTPSTEPAQWATLPEAEGPGVRSHGPTYLTTPSGRTGRDYWEMLRNQMRELVSGRHGTAPPSSETLTQPPVQPPRIETPVPAPPGAQEPAPTLPTPPRGCCY